MQTSLPYSDFEQSANYKFETYFRHPQTVAIQRSISKCRWLWSAKESVEFWRLSCGCLDRILLEDY